MAITLTQDSYRLWARIGGTSAVTLFGVQVTDTAANVAAQLLQLNVASIAHEGW